MVFCLAANAGRVSMPRTKGLHLPPGGIMEIDASEERKVL